jgi:hypothetical protein
MAVRRRPDLGRHRARFIYGDEGFDFVRYDHTESRRCAARRAELPRQRRRLGRRGADDALWASRRGRLEFDDLAGNAQIERADGARRQ